MVDPIDQFPDNFDINELLEPQPETITGFIGVCSQIDDLSKADYLGNDSTTKEAPAIKSLYFFRKKFVNGSTINAHSVHGDEEYLEAWGETEPTRSINLKTVEGIEYDYSAYTTGRERLFIKKQGERVIREVDVSSNIDSDTSSSIMVGVRGTPDFMRYMAEAIAERREADKLGLTKLTDGSLKEFTTAIQAALDSGLPPEDSK